MLKGLLVSMLVLWLAGTALAQNIQVKEEAAISQMMDRFASINKSVAVIDGWRIQILATPDRQKLESARQVFQYKYPNLAVDWVHTNPWYKLFVGAFSTKIDALRLQYLLKRDYPNAYLVRDNKVRPIELVGGY